MQLDAPALPLYAPGGQLSAAVARSRQWLPGGHSTHAVAPLAPWNEPAAHAAHTLCPPLAAIVPGSHGVWLVAPVAHAEPAGHAVQSACDVAPTASRYEPAAHKSATLAPSAQ